MRLCEERVRQLKRAAAEVIHSSTIGEFKGLVDLSRLIYSVRRSSSFKHFLQANLNRRPEPGISLPIMPEIIQRLSKIFKIYRAALTMNDFVVKIKELGRRIIVEAVPAVRISISELADRTTAQLRERAGLPFQRGGEDKVDRMLKRWPQYRQHAEIQLIISTRNIHISVCTAITSDVTNMRATFASVSSSIKRYLKSTAVTNLCILCGQ